MELTIANEVTLESASTGVGWTCVDVIREELRQRVTVHVRPRGVSGKLSLHTDSRFHQVGRGILEVSRSTAFCG